MGVCLSERTELPSMRKWRASLVRKRARVLGDVEALTRQEAVAAAIRQSNGFSLSIDEGYGGPWAHLFPNADQLTRPSELPWRDAESTLLAFPPPGSSHYLAPHTDCGAFLFERRRDANWLANHV
jgi:hypothetical protein